MTRMTDARECDWHRPGSRMSGHMLGQLLLIAMVRGHRHHPRPLPPLPHHYHAYIVQLQLVVMTMGHHHHFNSKFNSLYILRDTPLSSPHFYT